MRNTKLLHFVSAISLIVSVGQAAGENSSVAGGPQPSTIVSLKKDSVRKEIRALLKDYSEAEVVSIGRNGTPSAIAGNLTRSAASAAEISEMELTSTVKKIAPLFGLHHSDLVVERSELDLLGFRHVFYSISLKGIPVVGAGLALHFNKEGVLYFANGTIPDEVRELPSTWKTGREAARNSVAAIRSDKKVKFHKDRLVWFRNPTDGAIALAWELPFSEDDNSVQPFETAYVSAEDGNFIDSFSKVFEANRSVRDIKGDYGYVAPNSYYLPTTIARSEGGSASTSSAVNNGYDNVGRAHNYFQSKFGLNGQNGIGGVTNVIVNTYFSFSTGSTGQNAQYVNLVGFGDTILLGNNGARFQFDLNPSFAGATDIVGHEFTHGVLANRPIGSLGYGNNDTGALNEGLSDVFGAMTELHSGVAGQLWVIGEHVGNIRSLQDPASTSTADYYPTRNPNAGPHTNAGIPGLAFKLLSTGGTHPRPTGKPSVNVPGVGPAQAEQIFYRAAFYYLTPGANMIDFKTSLATAARDLYGNAAAFKVNLATDAVGIPYGTSGSLRAINISTRGFAGNGAEQMIVGFALAGSGSKEMLIRAAGPALSSFGVPGVLPNPSLTLYANTTQIDSNDNWGASPSYIATRTSQVGAFAFANNSLDSALIPSLTSGVYSAPVSPVGGQVGTALVEIYDANTSNPLRLVNISTRLKVTNSSPAIAGFIVDGYNQKNLLIRAAGPALGAYGVPGTIPNPQISLNWEGNEIYSNDNWSTNWNASSIPALVSNYGAIPYANGSNDAALLVTLPPGAYSAVVSGVSGAEGITLLEVFEVP